jgi:ATP-dependent helicase HepA
MMLAAEAAAEEKAGRLRKRAELAMRKQLDAELDRLEALAAVNSHVRPEESAALREERAALAAAIAASRIRQDCLRLVWRGPSRGGFPSRS